MSPSKFVTLLGLSVKNPSHRSRRRLWGIFSVQTLVLNANSIRLRSFGKKIGVSFIMLSTLFYSFGGLDLYLGFKTPFAPKTAGAAYTGKQLRTIEYALGNGSENTTQVSGVLSYFGSTTATTKAAAAQEVITIAGSGIRVVNAYLDVSFQVSASANVTGLDVFFDASSSAIAGTDIRVGEIAANTTYVGSGLSGYIRGTHDVTAFFATTSDANWNAGVGVVAAASTTFSAAASRVLTTVKLVVTYEEDFSSVAHNEVKTVRFPLHSNNGTDIGTRQAQCALASTCGFTYTANIPDAAADADILDVYFEIHAMVDSVVASTLQPQISGGTAGAAYAWTEAVADNTSVDIIFRPNIGAPNFTRNLQQTLNIITGLVGVNVLGGELVVTYRYSTGAAAQTETVRYFVDQDTTNPGVASSTFATATAVISNSNKSVKNIWYRVQTAPIAAGNIIVGSEVGTATKKFSVYAVTGTNPRSGDSPIIIHDMSADIGNFWNTSVGLGGESRASVSNAPVGLEAFVTFTWDGSTASDVTKTVTYSGAQQGVSSAILSWNNRPVFLELPETVTKTYRSAYLYTNYDHSNAGTISVGTLTLGVNGSTTAITENGDTESFNTRYLAQIASSTFSNGSTIAWTSRAIEINEQKSVANSAYFGNEVIITYDASLGGNGTTVTAKQLKTVEYVIGDGSDNTTRSGGAITYVGSSWSTTKGGAGTRSIILNGSNVRVVNAYLDVGFMIGTSANLTDLDVTLDVANSSSAGSDVHVGEAVGTTIFAGTGLTGYIRGNHDVTALFDRQTDSNWSSGVAVVASASSTFSVASTRNLTTMKLVITYESDYSLVPHTETKTVRFPLDSRGVGDTGTKQTACGISAVCDFDYTANIPDAAADADILDVSFDVHAEVNSAAAGGNFDFQITSMPTASQLYAWAETNTDDDTIDVIYRPPVGGTGFQRNTAQILNINNGSVPLNALGGEVVVTYRYSTGSTAQTDTVRYFENQATTTPGITRSNFATITPTVSNGTLSVKNIWYKVHAAPNAATNLTIFGRVGTSTEKSNVYVIAGTNPRAGDTPTLIYNMSADIGNFYTSTTTLAGASQYSALGGVAPPGVEAYITFTWNGSLGGTTTRSVLFSGAEQGVTNGLNSWVNRPVKLELPETVTKTFRSAYLEVNHSHSNAAATIAIATVSFADGGATSTIAENGDTEAFNAVYFNPIASSTFSGGNTVPWTKRSFQVSETKNVANYSYFSNVAVITYDAAQLYKFPTFTQNYYRFYVDNAAVKPTDPWPVGVTNLGENSEITAADSPPGNGTNLRLRMSLTVATTTMLASSTQFKLQYAQRSSSCSAIGSWNDLGAPGSGSIWRGFNAAPPDGTNLSTSSPMSGELLLSLSSRAGLYQESNNSVLNPFATVVGEDVEYDWNIQNNSAATDTPYCFRMVKSDGTAFDTYTNYPTARTAGYTAESKNWRWYDDENNETPTSPLAIENVAPTNIATQNILKLRVTLNETQGADGVNQKFMLQYSEWSDFSRGVTDLVSTTTCTVNSIWCYGDGTDVDDSAISTLLLSDSAAKGRHNEGATTTTTSHPLASTATEYEFTIKQAGARVNGTYFFRIYDVNHARPVPLASGKTYPSLSTQGATLTFTVAGLPVSTVTGGITTDVTTTASAVPFGTVSVGSGGVKAAQRITVATDATEGYQVFVRSNSNLTDANGNTIPDVTGTNAAPSAWATGCASGATGCYGYHSTDGTLSLGSIRFLVDDTYAKFSSTTLEEIMYNSGPVTSDTADFIWRLEAHQMQPAGSYTTSAQYIVVPIF